MGDQDYFRERWGGGTLGTGGEGTGGTLGTGGGPDLDNWFLTPKTVGGAGVF